MLEGPEKVHGQVVGTFTQDERSQPRAVPLSRTVAHSDRVGGVRANAVPGRQVHVPQIEPVEHLEDEPVQFLLLRHTFLGAEVRVMLFGHA